MRPIDPNASPDPALAALLSLLRPVATESVAWREAQGRIVAQLIVADRDSPPCDNSAMDGYAVRLGEVRPEGIPVAGDVSIGCPPPTLPESQALRIVTGAPLPPGAEAVIRREEVEERPSQIIVRPGVEIELGQNIRRQGENIRKGETVLAPGRAIDAAVLAAAATFGVTQLSVYRRVRVAVVITGNELRSPESEVSPWELRNSNGPALWAMLSGLPWLEPPRMLQAKDDPAAIADALGQCLADCDAVLLTGGVSMGQHDYVPDVIAATGAQIVFRKLPIRPGHPMVAAVGREGQAILGLPGNPVSVMVTARRFGAAVLQRLAGIADIPRPVPAVALSNPDTAQLRMWWFRPVRLIAPGVAELVQSKGSADVVATANSDGFVEIPPQSQGAGPWPFWRWTLE